MPTKDPIPDLLFVGGKRWFVHFQFFAAGPRPPLPNILNILSYFPAAPTTSDFATRRGKRFEGTQVENMEMHFIVVWGLLCSSISNSPRKSFKGYFSPL